MADRGCRGCGNQFTPTSKNQTYCVTCRTQCLEPGCMMKVRARGYCAAHLRQTNHVAPILPRDDLCGVSGCDRQAFCKGYCGLHYQRVRLYGQIGDANPRHRQPRGQRCAVEGCGRAATGGGYCGTHYARWRKSGDAGSAELLRRASGEGSVTEDGYRVITVEGKSYYEHRYVMQKHIGRKLQRHETVHHIRDESPEDKANNDLSNLELWSSRHPSGQRVEDKIDFVIEMAKLYPAILADKGYRLMPLESAEASELLAKEGFTFSDVMRAIHADMAE